MSKKATLADIIARKKQGKMDTLQVAHYDSETLGMQVEIRKIPLGRFMELTQEVEEGNLLEGMNKILFECCPIFKEDTKEAMEIYDVSVPTDLPSAVFEDQMNEMNEILELINGFYGMKNLDKEVKNS